MDDRTLELVSDIVDDNPDAISAAWPTGLTAATPIVVSESELENATLRSQRSEQSRVLHDSDAPIWAPILVWGSVFAAGSLCGRYLGVLPRNRIRYRLKLAGACAGLGLITHWRMATMANLDRVADDEDLKGIFTNTRVEFHTISALVEKGDALLRLPSPYVKKSMEERSETPGQEGQPGGLFARMRDAFQRARPAEYLWTSDESRRAALFWLIENPYIDQLSSEDTFRLVCLLAEGMDESRWTERTGYTVIGTSVLAVLRAIIRRPNPVTIWLNCLLTLSIGTCGVIDDFRMYQTTQLPFLIQDKAMAAKAAAEFPEGVVKLMNRILEHTKQRDKDGTIAGKNDSE